MGVRTAQRPAEEVREGRHVDRGRRTLPAGKVLVVALVCLLLWTVLDAKTLRKAAEASVLGARRTAALIVLKPIDGIAGALQIRRLSDLIERALGRDPNAAPGGGVVPITLPTIPAEEPMPGATQSPAPGANQPGERTSTGPLPRPTAKHPLRVLVAGDSFGVGIGYGLSRAFDPTVVKAVMDARISSGLARPDFFDWDAQMASDVRRADPDVIVVMIGANDVLTSVLTSQGTTIDVHDPNWNASYRFRVAQFMETARAEGARVVWVGLPIMEDAGYAALVRRANAIYRGEAATHPGVRYVDAYRLTEDPQGGYSAFLRTPSGGVVQVRDSDGKHLTIAGNEILAREIVAVMRHTWRLPPSIVAR